MKTFLTVICALAIGAVAGAICMVGYEGKKASTEIFDGIQQFDQGEYIRASLNLGLLKMLEDGQHEKVKSLLASHVASYYQTFHDFKTMVPLPDGRVRLEPMSPETRRLMQEIEASSEKSPALQEALKTSQK